MGLSILKNNNKKKHRVLKWSLGGLVTIIVIALFGAGAYFFNVAMVPSHKSFIHNSDRISKSDPLYSQKMWFKHAHKDKWTMKSASGNYRLVADYIPADHKTTKNVVILHGFMGRKEKMAEYGTMFHQLGYNVLMPDARAHGESQGKFIGYGWPERYDVRKWTKKLIAKNGQDSQVVIFGVSMGGATTMMTSGIQLPSQVKAFVEDCGYDSLNDELNYEAGNLYNIPTVIRAPLIGTLSLINRFENGFFTSQASATAMLKKNHRPMMFIHGTKDTFVPTRMVYKNYRATQGPKKLWLVKNAPHAASFDKNPTEYPKQIERFLNQYIK
ncbi:MAG: alpha/beta hydrolase [Limosilactobacillus sp.]|uniref:alpha/beta hydrolase n=1 Tax=Limosilactobacillus sp. TaxID=2773925 RepID=UPI0026FF569D|nr:alpha/beta hydrolase [Limosilactobacillus sp.]